MKTLNRFSSCGAILAAAFMLSLAGCGDDDGGTDPDATVDASDASGDAYVITDGQTQDATVVGPDGGSTDCNDVTCDPDCAVYVDHSLDTPGDGTTPLAALDTVQAGIDAAAGLAGACCTCEVRVAEGQYTIYRGSAADTLVLRERVHVYGGYATGFGSARDPELHVTILDGTDPELSSNHVYHVVTGADEARLDGFVVTGGRARADTNPFNSENYGGGLVCLGTSPTVVDCEFRDNEAGNGGSVYTSHSTATFDQCRFTDSVADGTGGGVHAQASALTLTRCAFASNAATHGAGLHLGPGSDAQVSNTTFWGNSATGNGGGVMCDGSAPVFTNNSWSGNSAAAGGALYSLGTAHPQVVNSVLWGDTPDELGMGGSASVTATYCDVQGGCTVAGGCTDDETGNLDVDPLFLDAATGDLRLWLESPLVDQGDNAASAGLTLDQEGDPRTIDGNDDSQAVVDLGADEVGFNLNNMPIIYVDQVATGANDGSSWSDAYTDLKLALATAPAFSQIWVAQGTYTPSDLGDKFASLTIPSGVYCFGGFAPTQGISIMALRDPVNYPAVLSGDIMWDDALGSTRDNSYNVVTSGNYTVLDGFTVTAGYNNAWVGSGNARGACVQVLEGHHFRLRNSRLTGCVASEGAALAAGDYARTVLEDNTFEGNEALSGHGGAVYLGHPSPGTAVTGCTFDGNTAYEGGGMKIYGGSGVTVEGCTFTGNTGSGTYYFGGGGLSLSGTGDVHILTTTFSSNSSVTGGGLFIEGGTGIEVEASTFDDNQTSNGGGILCDSSYEFMYAVGAGIFVIDSDLVVRGSTFTGNDAVYSGDTVCANPTYPFFFGVGGGIFARDSAVDVLDSSFVGNQARVTGTTCLGGAGGGLAGYHADYRVVNTTFRNNVASAGHVALNTCTGGAGGGYWSYYNTSPGDQLANSVFVGNTSQRGAGLFFARSISHLYGLTVTGNSGSYYGSGAYLDLGTVYAYNSIFWGNSATSTNHSQFALGPGGGCYGPRRVYTYYTLIEPTVLGTGCLESCTGSVGTCVSPRTFNPGFVNAGANPPDLHLNTGAHAVNAGSNNASYQADDWLDVDGDGDVSEDVPLDLDGNPRRNGNMDLGAYERP